MFIPSRWAGGLAAVLMVVSLSACGTPTVRESADPLAAEDVRDPDGRTSALELQAAVMGLADEYGAALGEAVYLVVRSAGAGARSRWLAQSFLRNGMGAAIDIGASSNPSVALLDLMVLAGLQTWAFETHWIPAGIGPAGEEATARLRRAEAELWESAARFLSPEQVQTLRGLVAGWIEAHPDRTVVSLVRFGEFSRLRRLPALQREQASGLLADVEAATVAVEDATLLGERLMWFAGRLPYVLGQQVELTTYRLADQPEAVLARESLRSLDALATTARERLESFDRELEAQRDAFFARLDRSRADALEDLGVRFGAERTAAIDQAFDRFAVERSRFFDELEERQKAVLPVMTQLKELIVASDSLTLNLTGTIEALDRVVARFDEDPDDPGEPLDINDVTRAASEVSRTTEKLTALLERTNQVLDEAGWERQLERVDGAAMALVDRAFIRGLILVGSVFLGIALLRFLPRRG